MKDIWSPIALKLDEQCVGAIMTTRDESHEVNDLIADCSYSRAVICRGGLGNVLGILKRSDLLETLMNGGNTGY